MITNIYIYIYRRHNPREEEKFPGMIHQLLKFKSSKKKLFPLSGKIWKEKVAKERKGGKFVERDYSILTWEFELGGLNIDIIPGIHFCRPWSQQISNSTKTHSIRIMKKLSWIYKFRKTKRGTREISDAATDTKLIFMLFIWGLKKINERNWIVTLFSIISK